MAIERTKGKFPLMYTILSVLVLLIITSAVIVKTVLDDVNSIGIKNNIQIIINEGWGLNRCAERFYDEKIIKYPKTFEFIAKVKNLDNSVKPGRIEIVPGMSYEDILKEL